MPSKVSPGVNFIHILCTSFMYESKLSSFSLITFGFAIFWCQKIGKKVAHKMLMKLTLGQNEVSDEIEQLISLRLLTLYMRDQLNTIKPFYSSKLCQEI